MEDPTKDGATIKNRARKIVIEHLDIDPEKLTDEADFIGTLGADSLDFVELTMAFEEEFDVVIPDDQAENFKTFGDAVTWLEAKVGQPAE